MDEATKVSIQEAIRRVTDGTATEEDIKDAEKYIDMVDETIAFLDDVVEDIKK